MAVRMYQLVRVVVLRRRAGLQEAEAAVSGSKWQR